MCHLTATVPPLAQLLSAIQDACCCLWQRQQREVALTTLLTALSLAACAAPPTPTLPPTATPGPTSSATSTLIPTATPSPTPTVTPSPTLGPGLDDLLLTPAALYLNADLEGAADAYANLSDLYPTRAEPLLGLAAVALRQGDVQRALGYLQEATEAEPTSFETWRQLAVLLEQQSRYADAIAAYNQMILLVPDDPDLYVARAMTYARLGQGDAAIADLQIAQSLDPYREYAWLNVTGAAYGARAYEPAIAIASAGLEAYPASVSLHLMRGQAALALGDATSALADFDAALALNDRNYAAYDWRGQALVALERYDEAATAFQRAGELGVEAGAVGANQAYEAMSAAADALARADPQAAFAYLATQVIHYGQPPPLLLGYALIEYRRGSIDAAVGRLNSLIELYDYTPAYYWRAVIRAEQGDRELAIADLLSYLAVRHAGPQVEAAHALLRALGADPDSANPA